MERDGLEPLRHAHRGSVASAFQRGHARALKHPPMAARDPRTTERCPLRPALVDDVGPAAEVVERLGRAARTPRAVARLFRQLAEIDDAPALGPELLEKRPLVLHPAPPEVLESEQQDLYPFPHAGDELAGFIQ
jgi:hypothetical protein